MPLHHTQACLARDVVSKPCPFELLAVLARVPDAACGLAQEHSSC